MSTHTHIIWVVDDDASIRFVLERALSHAGFTVESFDTAHTVLSTIKKRQPDVIISDVRMPEISGMALLQHIQTYYPDIPVIITTAHSDLDSAVSAYEKGAFEYLPKPFDLNDAVELVTRAIEKNTHITAEPATVTSHPNTNTIIGEAPAMQDVFRAIGRLSRSHITVLINGESGTGKELVANALHTHSPRANKPFIALNMAAIPKDLLEAELFGYEKGAFTGATSTRHGRFEQANGGTLFLDEIGDMPADLQTRLLRVLADGSFYRIGGAHALQSDVRIVAATHQHLETLVAQGDFREDLFHRLNVIRLYLPALRERQEDIPLLMNHFLERSSQELNTEQKILAEEALQKLMVYAWTGNVRQLENVCRWLTVMAPTREVRVTDLPPELLAESTRDPQHVSATKTQDWQTPLQAWAEQQLNNTTSSLLECALPNFEKTLIQVALAHTQGRKNDAAQLLGWGRNTLTRKCKELGL